MEPIMKTNRRKFLTTAAALAAASAAPASGAARASVVKDGKIDWNAVRDDFPWIKNSL